MEGMTLIPTGPGLDPTLFAINWDVTFEVLVMIVILSFIMERALAQLFESSLYLKVEAERPGNAKSLIAFAVAAVGCYLWQFDALSILLQRDQMTVLGAIITGAVVAGGSKASIKLFHDVMDVKSAAFRRVEEVPPPAAQKPVTRPGGETPEGAPA